MQIYAVEPKKSAVISGEKAGSHSIQGIGAGFVPKVLNTKLIDEIIKIDDDEAFYYGRLFCLLYTSPSPRDVRSSRMPSYA